MTFFATLYFYTTTCLREILTFYLPPEVALQIMVLRLKQMLSIHYSAFFSALYDLIE